MKFIGVHSSFNIYSISVYNALRVLSQSFRQNKSVIKVLKNSSSLTECLAHFLHSLIILFQCTSVTTPDGGILLWYVFWLEWFMTDRTTGPNMTTENTAASLSQHPLLSCLYSCALCKCMT